MSVTTDVVERGRAVLRAVFGFDDFRPGQLDVVYRNATGQDTLVLMPTGAGKSLCYQLPVMLIDGCTVVISPLIALMKDQVDSLPPELARVSTAINSSLSRDERERRLAALASGQVRLVYASPERLRQRPFLYALQRAGVGLFVVDEAHCVSLWGHDFRPDYLFIREALRTLGEPPLMALTATATPTTTGEIAVELGRHFERISTGVVRPNLHLSVERVRNNAARRQRIRRLCRELYGSGLIYVNAQRRAEQLAAILQGDGVAVDYYHAGLLSHERSACQQRFMDGETRVVVTTVALGLGVDKSDVRFVIHCDLPLSLETYVQEVGRAGRDGELSRCIALVTSGDRETLSGWLDSERPSTNVIRAVDRVLRRAAAGSLAQIATDDLAREVQDDLGGEIDDTQLRVAISVLERAGIARRLLDIPRGVSVRVDRSAVEDTDFRDFIKRARLPLGRWLSLDTSELAERSGVSLLSLEGCLLEWQARGWLKYRASERDLCVEIEPLPPDADTRIIRILDRMAEAQEQRIDQLFSYVEGPGCRHAAIAGYFDASAPEACAACDRCAPRRVPLIERLARIWELLSGR